MTDLRNLIPNGIGAANAFIGSTAALLLILFCILLTTPAPGPALALAVALVLVTKATR